MFFNCNLFVANSNQSNMSLEHHFTSRVFLSNTNHDLKFMIYLTILKRKQFFYHFCLLCPLQKLMLYEKDS